MQAKVGAFTGAVDGLIVVVGFWLGTAVGRTADVGIIEGTIEGSSVFDGI